MNQPEFRHVSSVDFNDLSMIYHEHNPSVEGLELNKKIGSFMSEDYMNYGSVYVAFDEQQLIGFTCRHARLGKFTRNETYVKKSVPGEYAEIVATSLEEMTREKMVIAKTDEEIRAHFKMLEKELREEVKERKAREISYS